MLNSLDRFLLQLRPAATVASAGVLCLSLTACGSDSADPEDSPSFSAAKESAPEANQAPSSADGNTEEKPARKTTTVVETPPEKKQDESAPSRGQGNGGLAGVREIRVVIVESVIIPPATDPISEPYRVHKKYPGSKIIKGGACSSLRSRTESGPIYAIIYEAGHNVDKVCELKAKYGGNARSLNNDADFSDPC